MISIKAEDGLGGYPVRVATVTSGRAPAALLCLAGIAIAGYAGVRWITGDQHLGYPAGGMGSPVAALAGQPLDAGPSPAESPFRSLTFAGNEPVPHGGHPRPGIASGLELTGVVMSGRASLAIIADAGGRDKVYRVGDQVRTGVTLAEVFQNGVDVAQGGLLQRLPLMGKAKPENQSPGSVKAISLKEDLPAAATPSVAAASAVPRRRSNFSPEVRSQGVIVPDPGGGFEFKKVTPGSLYARMGLRTGDVLRGANGQPIDSPEQLTLLYQQLNEGRQGSVELLRDGRPEALQFGGSSGLEPGSRRRRNSSPGTIGNASDLTGKRGSGS